MSEEKNNTNENPLTSENIENEDGRHEAAPEPRHSAEAETSSAPETGTSSAPETGTSSAPKAGTSAAEEPTVSAAEPRQSSVKDSEPAVEKAKRFFGSRKKYERFLREEAILARISDEELMDYLTLEQKRADTMQKARDGRDKRLLSAFQLAASLAAIVAVIALLKDEPTVLVNILYIIGVIAAMWIWKNPKEK